MAVKKLEKSPPEGCTPPRGSSTDPRLYVRETHGLWPGPQIKAFLGHLFPGPSGSLAPRVKILKPPSGCQSQQKEPHCYTD